MILQKRELRMTVKDKLKTKRGKRRKDRKKEMERTERR